jgi:TetR/AcrR family fatty acid metabolism transcriptional regulator
MRTKEGDKENDILNGAIKVFAEQGFFSAKIHKIAETADVAAGTVYLYFNNKEEILLKIFDQVWGQWFEIMEKIYKRSDIDSIEKFNSAIDAIFDYFTSNPSLALVFVNEQNRLAANNQYFTKYYDKTIAIIEKVFIDGVKSNIFNENVNVRVFSTFFFGGMRYLLHQWAQDQSRVMLSEIRHNAKLIMLHGVAHCKK